MKYALLFVALTGCCSSVCKPKCCAPVKTFPEYAYGKSHLTIDVGDGVIDRGVLAESGLKTVEHNGAWIMSAESFGDTVYLYDGFTLMARIVKPRNVK